MINKKQWLKLVSKIEQTFEDEFKAEFNSPELMYPLVKRLLQQHDCSKLLELLAQMSNEENEALGKVHFEQTYEREKHANRKYCLAIVMEMLRERQPIA